MSTFSSFASADRGVLDKVHFRVDSWAAEVLMLKAAALAEGDDPMRERRLLDDLFGSYTSRDNLARIPGSGDLVVVRAIDALFMSFTEEMGRGWIDLTGLAEYAGPGWWWARLPIAGPARDDYDLYRQRYG